MNNNLIIEKESLIEYTDIIIGLYTVKYNKNNKNSKYLDIVDILTTLRKDVLIINDEDDISLCKEKILHMENNINVSRSHWELIPDLARPKRTVVSANFALSREPISAPSERELASRGDD